jgi:hypothetical protein
MDVTMEGQERSGLFNKVSDGKTSCKHELPLRDVRRNGVYPERAEGKDEANPAPRACPLKRFGAQARDRWAFFSNLLFLEFLSEDPVALLFYQLESEMAVRAKDDVA